MRAISIFLLILFTACESEIDSNPCVDPEGDLLIRVANLTDLNFTKVTIGTTAFYDYGSLGPDEISCYQVHDMAYRYAYVKAVTQDDSLILQPIDYVGEIPLSNGKWTYQLSFIDTYFDIRAVED